MSYVKDIIKKFGGLTEMSKKISVPLTTIQSWKDSGKIPYWRQDFIMSKAKELGIEIETLEGGN